MTELRKRTSTPKMSNEQQNKENKDTKESKPKKRSFLFSFMIVMLVLLSLSYVITNTWTFGYKLPSFRKVKRVLVCF